MFVVVLFVITIFTLLIALWVFRTKSKFYRVSAKAKYDVMPSAGFINSLYDLFVPNKTGIFYERQMLPAKRYAKGDSIYHTFLFNNSLLVTLNPEDIQKILFKVNLFRKAEAPEASTFHRMLADAVGQREGEEWRRQRGILNPSFANLDKYVPIFDNTIQYMLEKWDQQIDEKSGSTTVEVMDQLQRMTLDVLAVTIFGHDLGAIDGRIDDLREHYDAMFELVFSMKDFVFPFLKTSTQIQHLEKFEKGINAIIDRAYEKKRQNAADRNSMLDVMIDSIDEKTNSGFTHKQVFQNVTGFFLAGHETTANILQFTLYELAKNKELQEKCREEVDKVLGSEKEITPEIVDSLEYIPLVIKEMQRLYQPTGTVPRVATADTELSGYHIPKNTMVVANFVYMHHDEKIWGDPFVFRPERFSSEESVGRHPSAYIPFSAGPHTCIGNKFSLLEQKIFYLRLLQKYTLDMCDNFEIDYDPSVGLLKRDFKVIVKRRS